MKRFKNILLYAGVEQNEAAVSRSVQLAMENDADLTFMDVVKPIPKALGMMTEVADSQELQRLVAQDHREKLLKIASEYLDTGVAIDIVVASGDPATEIVRQALSDDHDLVVKTADSGSSVGRLFGSVARSLLRICPCPLWLLKPETHGDFKRVLAAVDVEAADKAHQRLNGDILELASSIAERENSDLHVVSAWDLWMEQSMRHRAGDAEVDEALAIHEKKVTKALDKLLRPYHPEAGELTVHLHRGHAATVIRSVADQIQADLMVMGSVCRTGAAGFLIGNTAETVFADATCSLLTLKPEGFVSPVQFAARNLAVES